MPVDRNKASNGLGCGQSIEIVKIVKEKWLQVTHVDQACAS